MSDLCIKSDPDFQFPLKLQVQKIGCDWKVELYGGNYHLGAMALGLNGKILYHYECFGHKEGRVINKVVSCLSKKLSGKVLGIAGIHFPQISREEIEIILLEVDRLLFKLRPGLKDNNKYEGAHNC